MLTKLKNNNFAKYFLGFAIIALFLTTFGVYNTMVGDVNRETAVEVNGDDISFFVLRDFANKRMATLNKDLFGGDTAQYDQYIASIAIQDSMDFSFLQALAKKYDIKINDDLIFRSIANNRAFYDESGKFSAENFKRFLTGLNVQSSDFMDLEGKLMANELIKQSLLQTAMPKNTLSSRVEATILSQYRDIKILKYPKDEINKSLSISESEVVAYYDTYSSQFMNPSKVGFEYFIINDGDLLANKAVASNAELEKIFNEKYKDKENLDEVKLAYMKLDADKYSKEELKQKVGEIEQDLTSENFESVMKKHSGLSHTDSKMMFVNSYSDNLQEQIRAMKIGEYSKTPIFSDDGVYFIKVLSKISYSNISLTAVKDELAADWLASKKQMEYEDILKSSNSPDFSTELASKYKKKFIATAPVDMGGKVSSLPISPVDMPKLYSEDFLQDKGFMAFDTENGKVFVRASSVIPPSKKELKAVRPLIVASIRQEKAARIFTESVNKNAVSLGFPDMKALNDIKQKISTEIGVPSSGSWQLYDKLNFSNTKQLPNEVLQVAFSMVGSNKFSKFQALTSTNDKYFYVVELSKVGSAVDEQDIKILENTTSRSQIARNFDYFLNKNRVEAKIDFNERLTAEPTQ